MKMHICIEKQKASSCQKKRPAVFWAGTVCWQCVLAVEDACDSQMYSCTTVKYSRLQVSRKEIVSFFAFLVVPMFMSNRLWSIVS